MRAVSVIQVNPLRSSPSKTQQVSSVMSHDSSKKIEENKINKKSEKILNLSILSPQGVPSPPIELHVTGASRDFLSIAWKPPQRTGGCPISGYHVEMCEAGTEKWMRVNSRPVKELKFRVEEGVVSEKEYILRVRAINSVGVSEPSDISENVFAKESDCKNINSCSWAKLCKSSY